MASAMARTLDSTPAADGYRMPAEWEPHDRTWMSWPERPDTWRNGALPAQRPFTAVATAIAAAEAVTMAASKAQSSSAASALGSGVSVVELESDDAWMR